MTVPGWTGYRLPTGRVSPLEAATTPVTWSWNCISAVRPPPSRADASRATASNTMPEAPLLAES